MSPEMQTFIEGLQADLSGEYQAIISYITYASLMRGPFTEVFRDSFHDEVKDELRHAKFISDTLSILGGEVNPVPRAFEPASNLTEILTNLRDQEEQAIRDYTERTRQAEELAESGELTFGIANNLQQQTADETEHYHILLRELEAFG